MSHENTLATLRHEIDAQFQAYDDYLELPQEIRSQSMNSESWTIDEILEHVTLTNHFLLLTLNKWVPRTTARYLRGERPTLPESDLAIVDTIGRRKSFHWPHPEHMTPTGLAEPEELGRRLCLQQKDCLEVLTQLPPGAGALRMITMTVNDLGKIDLYQWLYFLLMHMQRHRQQIEEIRGR